jgi:hypothetical protein
VAIDSKRIDCLRLGMIGVCIKKATVHTATLRQNRVPPYPLFHGKSQR